MKQFLFMFGWLVSLGCSGQLKNGQYVAVSFDQWLVLTKDTTFVHTGFKPLLLLPPSDVKKFKYTVRAEPIPFDKTAYDSNIGVYSPAAAWVTGTQSGWYNNTLAYSNTRNATATFTFRGFSVEVYSEKYTTHGKIGITIDQRTEVEVDLYSSVKQTQVLVYQTELRDDRMHTLRIRVLGLKNIASTNFYGLVDFIKVSSYSR